MTTFVNFFMLLILSTGGSSASVPNTTPTTSKIVGGVDAHLADFPYVVSIRLTALETSGGCGSGFFCHGLLLSNRAVLTSERCVKNGSGVRFPGELTLIAGTVSRTNCDDGVRLEVEEIWVHDEASLAVLRLKWPVVNAVAVVLNEYVQTEDKRCILTGWGANSSLTGPVERLQEIYVRIRMAQCPEKMICAGDEKAHSGACFRDLGSPLLCDGSLSGVLVENPHVCGEQISVFTKTHLYNDWIRSQIARAGSAKCLEVFLMVLISTLVKFII